MVFSLSYRANGRPLTSVIFNLETVSAIFNKKTSVNFVTTLHFLILYISDFLFDPTMRL